MSVMLDAHIAVRLGDLDLDVALKASAEETIAVLGPNGAGKSTTLAALAGTLAIGSEGSLRISLDERVLDHTAAGVSVPPERRRVGVVFQDHLLFDHLDVLDNVAFGPRASGATRAAARDVAAAWLEQLGVTDLATRRPAGLSGGEAQRVAIARTLAAEPELLLLDEPLAALDVAARAEVRRVLQAQFDRFAGPRIIVTHDPVDAFELADRIVVIEHGRITQSGAPEELRANPATRYVAAVVADQPIL